MAINKFIQDFEKQTAEIINQIHKKQSNLMSLETTPEISKKYTKPETMELEKISDTISEIQKTQTKNLNLISQALFDINLLEDPREIQKLFKTGYKIDIAKKTIGDCDILPKGHLNILLNDITSQFQKILLSIENLNNHFSEKIRNDLIDLKEDKENFFNRRKRFRQQRQEHKKAESELENKKSELKKAESELEDREYFLKLQEKKIPILKKREKELKDRESEVDKYKAHVKRLEELKSSIDHYEEVNEELDIKKNQLSELNETLTKLKNTGEENVNSFINQLKNRKLAEAKLELDGDKEATKEKIDFELSDYKSNEIERINQEIYEKYLKDSEKAKDQAIENKAKTMELIAQQKKLEIALNKIKNSNDNFFNQFQNQTETKPEPKPEDILKLDFPATEPELIEQLKNKGFHTNINKIRDILVELVIPETLSLINGKYYLNSNT